MQRETMEPKRWIECDACGYTIGRTQEQKTKGWTLASVTTELRVPWPAVFDSKEERFLVFHFHCPDHASRDCFRYWAHNPSIMKRSLGERGLPEDEIEEFLATHLYRDPTSAFGNYGLERPKEGIRS